MRFQELRAFCGIIELGSVSAAASNLNISQPAASRMLSALETELGFKLFERRGKRVAPTSRGLTFYKEIQSVLAAIENLPVMAEAIRNQESTVIRMISVPRLITNVALPAIVDLRSRFPELEVDLRALTGPDFARSLARLDFDVALSLLPIDASGVEIIHEASAPLGLIAHRSMPIASLPVATAGDIMSEKIIALPPGARYREALDALFIAASIAPSIATTAPTLDSAISLVEIAGGVTIAEPFVLSERRCKDLVWVAVDPSPTMTYGILRPGVRPRFATEADLADTITHHLDALTAHGARTVGPITAFPDGSGESGPGHPAIW